uniref:TLDc domain-containing protein n=1 Tax=Rhizophagus irregularis (strain DAOM 181602 / DAOM 197198 / MUCL 43194) TaxID=747089 RepID=U9TRN6_RHIID
MREIEVWEHVLKWSLAQNRTLLPDPNNWSDDDFKAMKNSLQHCLCLIRFFSLSSKEFLEKVRPYKRLLNHQLYEDLLKSHLDPNSEPNNSILFPRNIRIESIIDTKIVNLEIASTILKWIDKTVIINNSKFDHLRELYLPYKFQLLLRGSRDGFTPKKFHELCDDKYNTITFIKVEGTEEIIGGYNPIMWSSSDNWGKTKHSFVFSFKEKDIKSAIISNIKETEHALNYGAKRGPCFGTDIIIRATGEFVNYNIRYQKFFYEKKIRDTGNEFSIEDYEVFQIKERE